MKKMNFISLILGLIGVMLFGFGMCLSMVPEFNAPKEGVIIGIVGIAVLLATLLIRRKMQGKAVIAFNGKAILAVLLAVAGIMLFGAGFCMTVVFTGMFLQGIIAAIAGVVLLLCLIPLFSKLT